MRQAFKNKKPQINADERRLIISNTLSPFKVYLERIFTDNFNPCASVSSVQSVFHLIPSGASTFICVHLRFVLIKAFGGFDEPKEKGQISLGVHQT